MKPPRAKQPARPAAHEIPRAKQPARPAAHEIPRAKQPARPAAHEILDWDAATYDRVSTPQLEWARPVIERLALRGDETVLDAGCGSGRVTKLLLDRLPRGRVIAVDAAPSMVEQARRALPGADVRQADLATLDLHGEPVDAVFSNAVFHWVTDHDALFSAMRGVLAPGGRLVAQCGGAGNVERFHQHARRVGSREPFAGHLAGWEGPWNFAEPRETERRLHSAGFGHARAWLEPRRVAPDEPEAFIRTVCLRYHLERLPEPLRGRYVSEILATYEGTVELDYVRLNIDAQV